MKIEMTDWAPDLAEDRVRVTIQADLRRNNAFGPTKSAANILIDEGAE